MTTYHFNQAKIDAIERKYVVDESISYLCRLARNQRAELLYYRNRNEKIMREMRDLIQAVEVVQLPISSNDGG